MKSPINLAEPIVPLKPPAWARGGHTQTILGHLLPSPKLKQRGERWRVPLEGGDVGVAEYVAAETGSRPADGRAAKTIVYLFHGLGGSTESDYIHRSALILLSVGYSVVMYNHRGCGEGEGLARHPYHSGRGEDLSAVIAFGKDKFPQARHLAVGFSLSANALLLLAAGSRGKVQPDAGIAVNAPINLGRAADLLEDGWNRIYDIRFMKLMREAVRTRQQAGFPVPVPVAEIPWFTSLKGFDNLYTAPAGGFRDREDYYQTCSAAPHLAKINIPLVVLTAKNDPFVDFCDYAQAPMSDWVHFHVEENGGHMGYLNAVPTPLGTRRWLDYAVLSFIRALP